jgi:type I restriction-modification system DNA methylase subunit/fido (protein-threonine AMPylation protein)
MGVAPSRILELVQQFQRNRDEYRKYGLNETQLRREYLDPFFEALGWDVANRQGHAPAYREVIHEDAVKIGGVEKAPDYSFRIGGTRKFFVEAKNPAVNLKDNPAPAYQLRRYAWSAKLPLSILTDFEEFVVYDCRTLPSPTDKPSAHRCLYLTYDQYESKWDEIHEIFSKDAILKGSFDKYAAEERKRGTATVDAEFLAEIEDWREMLAKNLAVRNRKLSVQDLNFAVQRTIDRIIFLRICEDRGAELYGQLQALLNGEHTYGRLKHLFRQADDRYNSGLFHFQREKERAEAPDELTLDLAIDDKVLKDIIDRLYAPKSPYEFSVFPIEILGQVYEQFLGKVIRLTAGHQAKVEEKPEVKKAGGVYYTPAYIVDYIVRQTVGELCKDKTPRQIASLRVLDPACGSGSFLIGAYGYLLAYHRDWYVKDGPDRHKKELYQTSAGDWRLTTQEKKRILLNNLHGVDIDPQAVEVTKLSLLLKVLEGESDETLKRQLSFVKERALPDLGQNIKCGNSLIGTDYFTGKMFPDDEEMRRINPFDWQAGFPEIVKAGGFDAVIGNPPYVRIQTMKEWAPDEVEAYKELFVSAQKGNYDIYVVFVEKGLSLLNRSGRLGFILPHKFFQAQYGEPLRKLISKGKHLAEVVHFSDQQVFEGATTYTCLMFLDKGGSDSCRFRKVEDLVAWRTTGRAFEGSIPAKNVTKNEWNFSIGPSASIFEKLGKIPVKLGDIADRIFQGIIPGADKVYAVALKDGGHKSAKCFSSALNKTIKIELDLLRELVSGTHVERYGFSSNNVRVIYPYQVSEDGEATLLTTSEMADKYPLAFDYFKKTRAELDRRDHGSAKGPQWYKYIRTQNIGLQIFPKIAVPRLVTRLKAAYDEKGERCLDNVDVGGVILKRETKLSALYALGLLNSTLLDFYFKRQTVPFRGGFFSANRQYIEQLPIRPINFANPVDKARHDKVVSLVERMLDLHKRLAAAKSPDDKTRLQSQIDSSDREIDRLVYDLYGLTEEEISIVENSVASKIETCEDVVHENFSASPTQPQPVGRQAARVAEGTQHAREGGRRPSKGAAGPGEPVHGVREPTGQYGPPEDSTEGDEGEPGPLGSTRYFDTAEGHLSYIELSERLAVPLVGILDEILQTNPDEIKITSEWLCIRHKRLAGHLFPDWAGRFRDVNVQVGAHTPPPFYEVPVLMRQFCDDLAERLQHIDGTATTLTDLLTWADWRFQWIHPFKDFNGRIGRILSAALLYKLGLPHVETAPLDEEARAQYLEALRAADAGDLDPLKRVWFQRFLDAL